ncbi:MAG: hypothetical protein ABIV28_02710 [Longimicrobiales bacterium]
MGKEARVIAEIEEWSGEGRLLLETDDLIFRGARRLTIPLPDITAVAATDGWIVVQHVGGMARFDIGAGFDEKWVHAILNPRVRIDKLDVKPDSSVLLVSGLDEAFSAEVRARASNTAAFEGADGADAASGAADTDIAFLQADDPAALSMIPALRRRIRSTGAIWVLHPRGRRDLSHDAIMAVAKPVGLVDVKSARFSETHGALKLMVPRAQRS